jgi:putative ABC transport system ATP-binding protein
MSQTIDYDQLARNREAVEEIRNPGSTARKRAAEKRQRIVAELRKATEAEYKDLLGRMLSGESVPQNETAQLVSALGKSLDDLPTDLEDMEAELADAAEAERVAAEKAAIEKKIGGLEAKAEKLMAAVDDAEQMAAGLAEAIRQEELKVAIPRRKRLRAVRQQKAEAAEAAAELRLEIEQLQRQLAEVRPACNHKGRLLSQRAAQKWVDKGRESDRAMAPYVFAQQSSELSAEAERSAINPKAPAGPPVQSLVVGRLNGEEVRVSVGKLG